MDQATALVIAVVAAPIIMQFIKATKLVDPDNELVPFIAGFFGFIVCMGAGYLLGSDINRQLIIVSVVAVFGPSGLYQLILKPAGKAIGSP